MDEAWDDSRFSRSACPCGIMLHHDRVISFNIRDFKLNDSLLEILAYNMRVSG